MGGLNRCRGCRGGWGHLLYRFETEYPRKAELDCSLLQFIRGPHRMMPGDRLPKSRSRAARVGNNLPRRLYGASLKMSYLYLLTPSTVALWKSAFSEYSASTLLRRLHEECTAALELPVHGWFTERFDTRD
jgi:hypothetical protein